MELLTSERDRRMPFVVTTVSPKKKKLKEKSVIEEDVIGADGDAKMSGELVLFLKGFSQIEFSA